MQLEILKSKVSIDHEDHQILELYFGNPNKLIKELLEILFDKKTLKNSTVNGKTGREKLDPIKIKAINGIYKNFNVYTLRIMYIIFFLICSLRREIC